MGASLKKSDVRPSIVAERVDALNLERRTSSRVLTNSDGEEDFYPSRRSSERPADKVTAKVARCVDRETRRSGAFGRKIRAMKRRFALAAILIVCSVGCSSSSSSSTSAPSAPSALNPLSGNWSSFWCQTSDPSSCPLSLSISQDGSTLSGTAVAGAKTAPSVTGTLTGTITGDRVSFRLDFGQLPRLCVPWQVSATTGENQMQGILVWTTCGSVITPWTATHDSPL
jgi:hypothetical protein